MTNIIFMGTPDFSVPILESLHKEFGVSLVVSQPNRPVGRKRKLTPPAVAKKATELGIPLFQPEKVSSESAVTYLKSYHPDLIVTAAYGQLLSESVLDLPKLGCINVHASLLPKHRGGAPIHRAIIEGDKTTGITLMYMEQTLDSGDVIAQSVTDITDRDTVGSLHDRLSTMGARLLTCQMPSILKEENKRVEQNHTNATFSPNIKKEDEYVNFNQSARAVFNQIRGLNPFPGAYTLINGERLKLYLSKLTTQSTKDTPGTIVKPTDDGFLVATQDKLLEITEVQPAGRKRMSAFQFIDNNEHYIGQVLGESR